MQFWTYLKGSYTIKDQTYRRGQKIVGACRIHTNMWENLPCFDDMCIVIWPPKSIILDVHESFLTTSFIINGVCWCLCHLAVFSTSFFSLIFFYFSISPPIEFCSFFLSFLFLPYLSITIPWISIPWKIEKSEQH